jgi:hypothetical protein
MTMIASAVAVLVPASVTIDAPLAAPLHLLPADRYLLGGEFAGPAYDPRHAPAHWRSCPDCMGTGRKCSRCGDAEPQRAGARFDALAAVRNSQLGDLGQLRHLWLSSEDEPEPGSAR